MMLGVENVFLNIAMNDPKTLALFVLLLVWSLIWKGLALWKAGRAGEKKWFIALLVINTVGLLEIIYFFTEKKKNRVILTTLLAILIVVCVGVMIFSEVQRVQINPSEHVVYEDLDPGVVLLNN